MGEASCQKAHRFNVLKLLSRAPKLNLLGFIGDDGEDAIKTENGKSKTGGMKPLYPAIGHRHAKILRFHHLARKNTRNRSVFYWNFPALRVLKLIIAAPFDQRESVQVLRYSKHGASRLICEDKFPLSVD